MKNVKHLEECGLMPTRKNFKPRLKKRREEAETRQEARSKRSNKQQLDLLIKRGHGNCKEARKLGK